MGPSQMLSTSQQHPRVAPALVLLQPGSLVQPPPLLHCKATAPALLLAHPQLCPGGIPTYPTHCWRGLWVDSPPLAPVAWNLDGKRDREGNVQGQVLLPCRELPGVRARAGAAAQVLQLTLCLLLLTGWDSQWEPEWTHGAPAPSPKSWPSSGCQHTCSQRQSRVQRTLSW